MIQIVYLALDNKWYKAAVNEQGFIHGWYFEKHLHDISEIKSIEDVYDVDSYLSIREYIYEMTSWIPSLVKRRAETIRIRFNVKKLYVKMEERVKI